MRLGNCCGILIIGRDVIILVASLPYSFASSPMGLLHIPHLQSRCLSAQPILELRNPLLVPWMPGIYVITSPSSPCTEYREIDSEGYSSRVLEYLMRLPTSKYLATRKDWERRYKSLSHYHPRNSCWGKKTESILCLPCLSPHSHENKTTVQVGLTVAAHCPVLYPSSQLPVNSSHSNLVAQPNTPVHSRSTRKSPFSDQTSPH